jgi:hypothetical protein
MATWGATLEATLCADTPIENDAKNSNKIKPCITRVESVAQKHPDSKNGTNGRLLLSKGAAAYEAAWSDCTGSVRENGKYEFAPISYGTRWVRDSSVGGNLKSSIR